MNGDVYASVSGNLQTGIIDSIKLTIPGLSTKYVDLSVQPNQTLNITLSQNIIFLLGNYVDLVVNGEVFLDNNGNAIKVPTDITVIDYTDVESAGTIYRFETIDIIENNIFISSKDRFYHPTVGRIEYVDTLGYSGVCGNLPDSGTLIISTTSTQYTVTPVYATTNNLLDCGTYKVTGGAI